MENEKDRSALPEADDVQQFLSRVEKLRPKILAFVTAPEIFLKAFQSRYPGVTGTPGRQQVQIADAEVWLLGSTAARIRGAALTAQEDLFFALGERLAELRGGSGGNHHGNSRDGNESSHIGDRYAP